MFKIHSAEKHANSNEKAEHEASQLSDKLSSFLCSFSSGSICSPVLLQMIEPQLQGGSPLGKGKGPWVQFRCMGTSCRGGQHPRESSSRAYQRTKLSHFNKESLLEWVPLKLLKRATLRLGRNDDSIQEQPEFSPCQLCHFHSYSFLYNCS